MPHGPTYRMLKNEGKNHVHLWPLTGTYEPNPQPMICEVMFHTVGSFGLEVPKEVQVKDARTDFGTDPPLRVILLYKKRNSTNQGIFKQELRKRRVRFFHPAIVAS